MQEKRFKREICEVTEFYVDENNEAKHNTIYRKTVNGQETYKQPSKYLKEYLEGQGVVIDDLFIGKGIDEVNSVNKSIPNTANQEIEDLF